MQIWLRLFLALVLSPLSVAAHCAANDVAVVVLHGKWGSPHEGPIVPLVTALRKEGFVVSAPEMPWSRGRLYDATVQGAEAEIGSEIARLRAGGATAIFVAGHSLGAAVALHYAADAPLRGIVAIAPGHRPEAPGFAKAYASEVRYARGLVAAGKGDEVIAFTDRNTGGRRSELRAKADAFVSYFDPAGPLNMMRNVQTLKPQMPVLWLVPTREEQPQRDGVVALFKALEKNPAAKYSEPDADHLGAPAASISTIIEWIRSIAAKN